MCYHWQVSISLHNAPALTWRVSHPCYLNILHYIQPTEVLDWFSFMLIKRVLFLVSYMVCITLSLGALTFIFFGWLADDIVPHPVFYLYAMHTLQS